MAHGGAHVAKQAAHVFKRSLAICEKVYSGDHPKVAIRANNIGLILKDQGDRAGALPYFQSAVPIVQSTCYQPPSPNQPLPPSSNRKDPCNHSPVRE